MTYLHTCVGCSQATLNRCDLAAHLREAVRGLGVSSIRHRCSARVPLYKLGDAVEVLTVAYQGGDDDGPPPKEWFPGVFISEHGTRCVAFIKPGTEVDGYEFETNGKGFVKVPLSRIRPGAHEAPDMRLCGHCGDYIGLTGECGNPDARLYWPAMCALAALPQPEGRSDV